MPGRTGPRFAIEALFLIALAVGAGYADLETKWIVLIMAAGWLVVALLELTTERIWATVPPWRRPYYVPAPPPPEAEAEPAPAPPPEAEVPSPPPPEEATVVAARLAEPEPLREPEPEPVSEPEPEREPVPEPQAERLPPKLEPLDTGPKRRWLRRRRPEPEAGAAAEPDVPKHVRLLPASERGDRVSQEVADLFDGDREDGAGP
jgi:outer membrane biosynthesis protein TonB